jgi:exopolysaccharide production protein ExoZ
MGGSTILNLQVLRGIAAMGVVFYHTGFLLAGGWHTEFSGVAIFFVLSGFIMSYISQNGEQDFLPKRLIRIVPLYWIAIATVLITSYQFRIFRPSVLLSDDPPLIIEILRSMLFLPWSKFPVLAVGWTLNFEIYFYLVFAAMIAINRRFAPVLTAAFVLAVIQLDRATGEQFFLLHYYSDAYIAHFVDGIVIYYVWTLLGRFTPPVAGPLLATVIVLWFAMEFAYPLWPAWLPSWLSWGPGMVTAAALFMESAGVRIAWRPLLLLGDASYSIYLFHTIWFGVMRPYLRDFGLPTASDSIAVMLFSIVSAAMIGIAIHLWIEKPILARLRGKLRSRRPEGATLPEATEVASPS